MRDLKARFAAFLLAILASAGCSSSAFTTLAYNNAALAYSNLGPMLTWMVDDYVDMSGQQKGWVRERLTRAMAWHRAEELPEYRRFFEWVIEKSDDGISADEAREPGQTRHRSRAATTASRLLFTPSFE